MTLGKKLQKLRKRQGLSQEALAEKVKVTRQTISKWELDQSTPDLVYIDQLSGIFGVSTDYLIKADFVEPDAAPLSKKKGLHFTERLKHRILAALSATAVTAIFVCLICDSAVCRTGHFREWAYPNAIQ